jgi:hypothetical protein
LRKLSCQDLVAETTGTQTLNHHPFMYNFNPFSKSQQPIQIIALLCFYFKNTCVNNIGVQEFYSTSGILKPVSLSRVIWIRHKETRVDGVM